MNSQHDNPLRHLGKRSIAALQLLLQSPMAEEAVAAAEAQEVGHRAVLAKRLLAMPEEHAKTTAPMLKRAEQCRAALAKAEAQLAEALKDYADATNACTQAGRVYDMEASALTRRLEDGADPRISAFAYEAMDLAANKVRHVMGSGGNEAFHALTNAAERALALRLFPLSRAEVTATLRKISNDIRPALAAVGMEPPAIEEDIAVLAPADAAAVVH